MTELVNHSTERLNDAAYAVSLLHHYGFDLSGYTIAQLLSAWQGNYPAAWIRLATIEALYQGRYKAISVEQILALWQRRSQPLYHFNHEFERLVCDHLPESLLPLAPSPQTTTRLDGRLPRHNIALHLPSFEGAVLPESDVMLALRTLHSEEMAVLTESQKRAETDKPASLQTYSYKLRSDGPSSSAQPGDASTQSEIDPTLPPPEDSDVSLPAAIEAVVQNDEGLQNEPIALAADPSDQEQATAVETAGEEAVGLTPPASALPASQSQAVPSQTASIARILQQLDNQELHTRVMLPGFGLMAHALKPKLQLHPTARYQPIWLTETARKQPIHQFTPAPEPSDFHSKLKAVAQPAEAADADDLTPDS